MMSKAAIENYQYFYTCAYAPLRNPKSWIESVIQKNYPSLYSSELINSLNAHLHDFLSIHEVIDRLEYGGSYDCEVCINGNSTKWRFEHSEDNPYNAELSLSLIDERKEGGEWLHPEY